MGVHTFSKGIHLKVNEIAPIEIELTNFETAVQYYRQYTPGASLIQFNINHLFAHS